MLPASPRTRGWTDRTATPPGIRPGMRSPPSGQVGAMSTQPEAPRLPDALQVLRERLAAAPLRLDTPRRDAAAREARAVVAQVDDYLLPRLRDLDAPLLTVVGGSTGAGKSTLVNSLLGVQVTTAGVLRPTTRSPVLVCSPADEPAFSGDRVLPGLARSTGSGDTTSGLRLVATEALPP